MIELCELIYFVQAYDLSIGLLHFPKLHEEVPEPRLSNNGVHSEYPHAIELRSWISFSRQMSSDDLIFGETP